MTTPPPLRIDLTARTVTLDGHPITLTRLQFNLLAYLATRPGTAVSREEIIRQVWRTTPLSSSKTIDTHLGQLRRLLHDTTDKRFITALRAYGFRFEPGLAEIVKQPAANQCLALQGAIVCPALAEALVRIGQAETAIARIQALIDSYPPGSQFVASGAARLFRDTLDGPTNPAVYQDDQRQPAAR